MLELAEEKLSEAHPHQLWEEAPQPSLKKTGNCCNNCQVSISSL